MEQAVNKKQEFLVKNLKTCAVTLYPSRAQVVREISGIKLQQGVNAVEIYGLTPTADESSIRLESTSAVTISDIAVELVSNREIFEDVYPDDANISGQSSDEDSSSSEEGDDGDALAKALGREIERLGIKLAAEDEICQSVQARLTILDKYSSAVNWNTTPVAELEKTVASYKTQRQLLHSEHIGAMARKRELETTLGKKEAQRLKATKQKRKEKGIKAKQKSQERDKLRRQEEGKRKETQRINAEHLKYWPRKVYRLTFKLEVPSQDTPESSRRTSVSSTTLAKPEIKQTEIPSASGISLALTYVTSDASWKPKYDIHFATPTKSGDIVYRAEYRNHTSETWADAKIWLSTSQTSFQGVGDSVPFMDPWHIAIARHIGANGHAALASRQELDYQHLKHASATAHTSAPNRNQLFGRNAPAASAGLRKGKSIDHEDANVNKRASAPPRPPPATTTLFASQAPSSQPGGLFGSANHTGGGIFGAARNSSGGLFGGAGPSAQQSAFGAQAPPPPPQASRSFDNFSSQRRRHGPGLTGVSARREGKSEEEADEDEDEEDDEPVLEEKEEEEPSWEDTGLTTTYEIPGLRTLAPSSLSHRHKIATLHISDLQLSCIAVPKLRQAAFTRVRFHNPMSTLSLLKGSAGLTLDSTFLGNVTLPRLSPGQPVTLPLGVDPTVHITYAGPTVHHSTTGAMFSSKEACRKYLRVINISNTKSTPLELLVLDQVPLSEEEKLKVEILSPFGLIREGASVSTGTSAKEGAAGKKHNWGRAVAELQKDGKIEWKVNLEKGGACSLTLEYEARAPADSTLVSH